MRMILALAGNVPLVYLAKIVDKIAECAVPVFASVTQAASVAQTSDIEERLQWLRQTVNTLNLSCRRCR